jgi:hypothetical protein
MFMPTQLHCPVRLSLNSMDAPLSELDTVGTLYPQTGDRYHLVMTEPLVQDRVPAWPTEFDPGWHPHSAAQTAPAVAVPTPRLLWFEFSPYRATVTMQGNGQLSYRHLFEPSVFSLSRYWLQAPVMQGGYASNGPSGRLQGNEQLRLRNFTRLLHVKGNPLPRLLLIDYELWSGQTILGRFELELEMNH